jgi:hypothetical protein
MPSKRRRVAAAIAEHGGSTHPDAALPIAGFPDAAEATAASAGASTQLADQQSSLSAAASAVTGVPGNLPREIARSAAQPPVSSSSQHGCSSVILPLPEQFPASKRFRRGRSSKHKYEISRLADVEVQIILHWLNNEERLLIARVSRRMRQLVSQPFCWKYATVAEFEFSDALPQQIQHSFIRFSPIGIRIPYTWPLGFSEKIASVPNLRSLAVADRHAELEPLLLTLAGVQKLTRLDICRIWADRTTLQLASQLPALHTLRLSCRGHHFHDPRIALACLADAPALSSLHLNDGRDLVLAPLAKCKTLKRLVLQTGAAHFVQGDLAQLFSSSLAASLQHLCLHCSLHTADEHWIVAAEDYSAAFRALVQLRSVSVKNLPAIDVLLSQVCLASALGTLAIVAQKGFSPSAEDFLPSPAALTSLLLAMPRLRIFVTLGGKHSSEVVESLTCVNGIQLKVDLESQDYPVYVCEVTGSPAERDWRSLYSEGEESQC